MEKWACRVSAIPTSTNSLIYMYIYMRMLDSEKIYVAASRLRNITVINPRHACAARVTVLVSVFLRNSKVTCINKGANGFSTNRADFL